MASWAMFAAKRKLVGVVAAADQEQAKLLRDAIDKLGRLNPWLSLQANNYRVVNRVTGSTLDIISADAPGSYGLTPDFVIVDELTHWRKQDLWVSLFSAVAKRDCCVLMVITNAGNLMGSSWQWHLREAARTDPRWYFSRLDGPQASWISKDNLEEQRKLLPKKAFDRLWLNQWQTESGEGLDMTIVQSCVTLLGPMGPDPSLEFVGGLDLGIKHDHSAAIVLACQASGKIKLANRKRWKPDGPRHEVDLIAVKRFILETTDRYNMAGWYYDTHQAELMAQELRAAGVVMVPVSFQGKGGTEMARALVASFSAGTLELYDAPELMADLQRLTIIEGNFDMLKLTAISDEAGHADEAIALALALPGAVKFCRELAAGLG